MEARLTLEGEFAKDLIKNAVGDKVTLTIEAVVTRAEMRPDYSLCCGPSDGKDKKKQKKIPCIDFVIAKVNGKSGKSIADLDDSEMEDEIMKTKRDY